MRLVRLAREPSRVADDIRAALASLGRGSNVVGGIALIGVRPPGCEPVDAIALLPRGALIVIGVDLPDPALRLEAPLDGRWKADGWPLVRDHTVNPATDALGLAETVADRLRETPGLAVPIGTVVAVGPFVDHVEQPAADLAGTVRVLHPTPTSMLAATVSLASAEKPCSVRQVRALLEMLAPDAPPITDETLLGEGFAEEDADPLPEPKPAAAAVPAEPEPEPEPEPVTTPAPPPPVPAVPAVVHAPKPAPAPPPPPPPPPAPEPEPEPVRAESSLKTPSSRTARWLPLGAVALLALIVVLAIVLATSGGSEDAAPASTTGSSAAPAPSVAPAPPNPSTSGGAEQGIQFSTRASSADQRCASHAYGDVQASLQRTSCTGVQRASFTTTVDGRQAAVTVAVISFSGASTASEFKQVADTPGGGGIVDVATETGKWETAPPRFEGAAYTSGQDGTGVRLVQACWVSGPSNADDPGLVKAAAAALTVSMPS